MKIVVYSAIFGDKDQISDNQPFDCNYVLFTDRPINCRWTVINQSTQADSSRASRYFKLLPHVHFPGYDYSIWVDGNMELIWRPLELIRKFLIDTGHFHAQVAYDVDRYAPTRNHSNIYHEALHCINLRKDDPIKIKSQIESYKAEGFPETPALWMGGIIIRQHNHPCSKLLGDAWYAEIVKQSRRDQIALPYVLWKLGLEVHTIDPSLNLTRRLPHLY
jgi:hypothetical protein